MATLSTSERRAINLTWTKPFDGNSPLIRYVLEMSENSKAHASLSQGGTQRPGWAPAPRLPNPPPLSKPFLWRLSFLICQMMAPAPWGLRHN